mmetsp:Transcript_19515/g.39288  ORF Transcript_19515/g.39288 Transcript_19515/m.39288 type:complete len:84 (-) Transcript_19515:781-1032(-)
MEIPYAQSVHKNQGPFSDALFPPSFLSFSFFVLRREPVMYFVSIHEPIPKTQAVESHPSRQMGKEDDKVEHQWSLHCNQRIHR